MGSFLSKSKSKPIITAQPTENAILVNDAIATIKANIPDCIVTTIALKDEDVYVPQNLGLNHYVVTYDAVSGKVIRVYSDL